jgi:sulfur-carrier protein
MPPSVFIPAVLRAFSGGADSVELPPAPTLRAALEALFARHPGLRDRVLTETGEIRRHVNVFVGAERCRDLDAPLAADAELAILPAVSGG